MTVTATPVFPQALDHGNVAILPTDASGLKTVLTGGANGTIVRSLQASSIDTSARDLQWGVTVSATFYPRGTVTIPITAGTVAGTPSVDMLSPTNCPGLPLDSDGNPFCVLKSGETLQVKTLTTVTVAKSVNAMAIGSTL